MASNDVQRVMVFFQEYMASLRDSVKAFAKRHDVNYLVMLGEPRAVEAAIDGWCSRHDIQLEDWQRRLCRYLLAVPNERIRLLNMEEMKALAWHFALNEECEDPCRCIKAEVLITTPHYAMQDLEDGEVCDPAWLVKDPRGEPPRNGTIMTAMVLVPARELLLSDLNNFAEASGLRGLTEYEFLFYGAWHVKSARHLLGEYFRAFQSEVPGWITRTKNTFSVMSLRENQFEIDHEVCSVTTGSDERWVFVPKAA